MPKVNPEILVWARETAGLSVDVAAKKVKLTDSKSASASEKLRSLESGEREPTVAQLANMARTYRRPLVAFYLESPPKKGRRGTDFRGLAAGLDPLVEGRVDALLRWAHASQSILKSALEDEQEPLDFIGSCQVSDGVARVLRALRDTLKVNLGEFRKRRKSEDAFNYLRERAHDAGVFVLLRHDLGSYHTNIEPEMLRGFSIADPIAPYIVINDRDAKSALSFTLLHEMVHLLLGQSAISGYDAEQEIERFCDDVASEFLLPTEDMAALDIPTGLDLRDVASKISEFADQMNVSRSMVAYKAARHGTLEWGDYSALRQHFHELWMADRRARRSSEDNSLTGPSTTKARRNRLGTLMLNSVRSSVGEGILGTSKAALVLGVKPGKVGDLIEASLH